MPITTNFVKAQGITKARLREERKSLLEQQDVAYMRAQEAGEDTSGIVEEKQRLRDLPELVDSTLTLDGLKGLSA